MTLTGEKGCSGMADVEYYWRLSTKAIISAASELKPQRRGI